MINRLIYFCFFTLCSFLYAKDLDYRQVVFGNAYENIIEVNSDAFFEKFPTTKNIEEYGQGYIIQNIKYEEEHFPDDLSYLKKWYDESLKLEKHFIYSKEKQFYFRVFKEQYGNDIFYRMLVSLYKLDDKTLLDWKNNYYEQELFYQISDDELIHVGSYTYRYPVGTQGGTFPVYNNVEIIQRKNKVNGIIVYNFYNAQTTMMDWKTTWQGHEGSYFSIDDIITLEKNSSTPLKSANLSLNSYDTETQLPSNSIFIGMPNPLIDSKRPFLYTLQNAFDGMKNTSFVEDTENSLFDVIICYDSIVEKLAIINGYASDKITYTNNNRIKTISREILDNKINQNVEDDILNYQIFNWECDTVFQVDSIYKGAKYNDTCLAEINFYTKEKGWLFGDINE